MSLPLARLMSPSQSAATTDRTPDGVTAAGERRRHGRTARLEALRQPAGRLALVDVSSFGCCVRHANPAIGPGHFVGLVFASLGTITGYVRWREDENMGVEFCRALAPAAERALATDEPLEQIRRL